MSDQRSAFRFRLPWFAAAAGPLPTNGPRPLAQSTASATPAPEPWRTAETQIPSQPTSTTTPAPAQSTAPEPRRTAENQVPSQPTSTTTPIPIPQTVDTKTLTQPTTSIATSTITPQTDQAQAPTQSNTTTIPSSTTPQKAETEAPSPSIATITPTPTAQSQSPNQSTTPTSNTPANTPTAQKPPLSQPAATGTATTINGVMPPLRPPGVTSQQAPLSQPQASRIESQPSSPSHVASRSRVSSQPAAPSRATTQSRSSQPSTPFRAASQSQATSPLSSPSRTGPPKSPTPRTTSQPRSQSRVTSHPAGQTSSTSPSSKAAQEQPTTVTLAESTSPSKREARLSPQSSQPFSSSTQNPSSTLEKEPKSAVSEQQSLEQLQLEETKSGMVFNSQKQALVDTSTEPMTQQPLKDSGMRTTTTLTTTRGPQTSGPTPKSGNPTRSSGPQSFPDNSKPEETKEVKEIMQEAKEKTYKEARDKDDYLLTTVSGSAVQTKEKPSFTFQLEHAQRIVDRKEMVATPDSNGKETKPTAQTRNKTMESSKKLAMTNGEHIPLHKEIRDDISKLVQKMAAGDPKHSIDDGPVTVITLAGENRGTTMHLGTDSMKKGGAVPIRRGYKVNADESAETTTDGEGSFKVKSEDTKDIEDQAAETYVNSNVQGINNSITFNSSITERNPGVHLVHSHFPTKLMTSTAETELLEKEKTKFSMAHAQKLTYEPMVRRRCLRGLLLESSDSDQENTTKPRRHGCRVGCKEKSKENKIDVS